MIRSTSYTPRALAWLVQLLAVLFLWAPGAALAREVPPLRAHVNDEADMLSASVEQRLEQRLMEYERRSQQQFALLTIESLEGDALEDFSMRVVESWKLGKKGKDDGLLLLVVKRERKLRIEVGYGLEGDITDAFSSRVIRNVLTPALRAGQAERGISQAFDVLMQKASGEAVPESAVSQPRQREKRTGAGAAVLVFFLLLFVLPALLPFFGLGGRRRGFMVGGWGGYGGGGGGWGGGGGGGGGWGGGGGGGFGGGGSSGSW